MYFINYEIVCECKAFFKAHCIGPLRFSILSRHEIGFLCVNTLAMELKSNLSLLFAITRYYKCTPTRNIKWLIAGKLLGNGEWNR